MSALLDLYDSGERYQHCRCCLNPCPFQHASPCEDHPEGQALKPSEPHPGGAEQ